VGRQDFHRMFRPVSGRRGLPPDPVPRDPARAGLPPIAASPISCPGRRRVPFQIGILLVLSLVPTALKSREKDTTQYGASLIVNIPFPEAEVTQAVEDVAQNGVIRGTQEYAKDEYISGASVASSCRVFPQWTEGGKVFYKVRAHAIDPQNFKDSSDVGTLAVRYVVQGQGGKNTVLRIDALFSEDFRHSIHQSNGSVEGAEYKDIHDHLDAVESLKQETAEAQKEQRDQLARKQTPPFRKEPAPTIAPPAQPEIHSSAQDQPETLPQVAAAPESDESLEQRVQGLRRQVERLVKAPGAALKSAPFRTASNLKSLTTGTEVLIVIPTTYWYGVETRDGQHGWISRDQLEPLP
jgi:hypothetical protein